MRLASDCMTSGPLQQGLLLYDNVDAEDGGEIGMERDGFMHVFSVQFRFFPSFFVFRSFVFSCIESGPLHLGGLWGANLKTGIVDVLPVADVKAKRIIHLNCDAWEPRQTYGHLILIK